MACLTTSLRVTGAEKRSLGGPAQGLTARVDKYAQTRRPEHPQLPRYVRGERPERPIQVDGLRLKRQARVSACADRAVSQPKPVTMLARWNNPARLTSRGD
jgi:hypothetical protein